MRCATLRTEVLETARAMRQLGLVTLTAGNVCARDPATGLLVITPTAVPYESMMADDVVVCRPDGGVLEGRRRPSSELPMHRAVLGARPDLGAAVHTHSPHALALAAAAEPVPPICLEVVQCGGRSIEVADWALPGSAELGAAALAGLTEGRRAVLLRNHGLLAVGATPADALATAVRAEAAAQVYVLAQQAGTPRPLSEAQLAALAAYLGG